MEGALESLCSLFKKIIVLTVYAPAKINLVLEVLGKNNDYHRISSIVQSIDLCDVLNFQLDEEICFECAEPSLKRDNLATQAAALLKESTKCSLGARIELRKHIPWGVGLGGGSSDAAATLLALNELWGLGLLLSELVHLASKLGSDVPFFTYKGTALVEGKGEKVTPLPSLPSTCFVLLVPPLPKISGKTKQMYNNLDAAYYTKGQFVQQALSSLRQGKPIDPGLIFNVFEKVAFDFFPGLNGYRKTLEEAGAPGVYLAGSGPCLFTFFSGKEKAGELFSRLKKHGLECYLASSFPNTNVAAGL
ncbi:MAG: 4-(cytidine 5'-diphospho)-2-C-methyl-D-erythritol kinase [Chloroflexota bacterium]|nr:4-(cytidine 5'-diphospho)-2-C-methyl-D-erythritol kinase [Chloroflexota bacterium]